MSSILADTKKMLGLDKEYDVFDLDLIIHINSAFLILNQIGVGPASPYSITGYDEQWEEFFGVDNDLGSAKTYMYARVKLLFDIPDTSYKITSLENTVKELEWRLQVASEGAA